MEWRVDGSKHRLDRSPSSCRSLPIQQARFREHSLWGTLTILSLFAGTVMASPETLGAASGSLGSAGSASMEKNNMETPSRTTWNEKKITIRDLSASEFLRAERSPSRSSKPRRNSRRAANGPCRLHRLTVDVRSLGLGYETKESVLLKYCSGTCAQNNYDVILNYIMKHGIVAPRYQNFVSEPCCRPTEYENFSFLDEYNVWQIVDKGSATACRCVG